MNLSAVLKHSSLLGHWLRCVLSPSKHFVAGGLQPIQTIVLTDRQPSGKERRNSHDIAQQLLCAQSLQVFCLICCPNCWSALLSRISQKGKEEAIQTENMSITRTSNSAWEDLKLSVNAFNDEHQVVQIAWCMIKTRNLKTGQSILIK